MRTLNKPTTLLAAVLALLIGLFGCSRSDRPELGEVTGKVTLDGQSLSAATVVFSPTEGGRQSMAVTDAEGNFEIIYIRDIKGAKIGPHKVRITTATEEKPEERLPARYNAQTELTAQVQPGSNEIPFGLTSE